jgi:hypothetical protein
MGVSYNAVLYLGITVTWADFLETQATPVVICTHPEAEGQRFCPECGAKADERTQVVELEVPRERFREKWSHLDPQDEDYEDTLDDFKHDWGSVRLDQLALYEHPEAEEEGDLLLAAVLGCASTPWLGNEGCVTKTRAEFDTEVNQALADFKKWGFDPTKGRLILALEAR